MKKQVVYSSLILYKYFFRKIIFLFDSEFVHELTISFGNILGNLRISKYLIGQLFQIKNKSLNQKIVGINFENPIGLAAGFDYEAKLYNILPSLSFGFETIGTITNSAYKGNEKPRLGRLVKLNALLVNKGFKNDGIKKIVEKLKTKKFSIPIGISIGKTNTVRITTQKQAIDDIISAFKIAKQANLNTSYYELNISCPNLFVNIDFYNAQKLDELLKEVFLLNMKKPIFIKMPISKTNQEIIEIMNVIIKYPVGGVIIGNLQTDRTSEILTKEGIDKSVKGNFSGKLTENRSNELINMIYKKYGNKIIIIGCGGVFSAEDAYKKIKLGASLIQLITGLVFKGPVLVSQINLELPKFLTKDGFKNISQAVGKVSI